MKRLTTAKFSRMLDCMSYAEEIRMILSRQQMRSTFIEAVMSQYTHHLSLQAHA